MGILLIASQVIQGNADLILDSGQIIIGRLPSNNLAIPGADVEPIHALIEIDPQTDTPMLTDLGSESGVKLNGRRIDVSEKLKFGDSIQIGNVTIAVLDPQSQDARAQTPPLPPPSLKGGIPPIVSPSASALPNTPRPQITTAAASPGNNRTPTANITSKQTAVNKETAKKSIVPGIFQPGKERPSGSTLEVVAYWDQSILDVRHYGGLDDSQKNQSSQPSAVYIGNEEDGHIIGVGPHGNTRRYLLARCNGSKTIVHLNSEMKARVRSGQKFERISGPREFSLSSREIALISHGPVSYFMMNVSLPSLSFPRFKDLDGKPFVFVYAVLLWLGLSLAIFTNRHEPLNKSLDADPWSNTLVLRKDIPKEKEPPKPKPKVEVPKIEPPKVKPPEVKPPPPKPKELPKPPTKVEPPKQAPPVPQPPKVVTPPKAVSLQKPKVVEPPKEAPNKGAPKAEKPANDTGLGRPKKGPAGNNGGPSGGLSGAAAGQRQGKEKLDRAGREDGKKEASSGINLDQLGVGLGKVIDASGAGAIEVGAKSSAGGAGRSAGTGGRGAHGVGGLGNTNSLAVGSAESALVGLGGGGGGIDGGGGRGGRGGPGGSGKRVVGSTVVAPESDPVIDGGLSQDAISAVIRANMAQIRHCYEVGLQGNRNLAGRIKTEFIIGTDGRVTSCKVSESSLNHGPTESCISSVIKRWNFPIPSGGTTVKVGYPFVFNPG